MSFNVWLTKTVIDNDHEPVASEIIEESMKQMKSEELVITLINRCDYRGRN